MQVLVSASHNSHYVTLNTCQVVCMCAILVANVLHHCSLSGLVESTQREEKEKEGRHNSSGMGVFQLKVKIKREKAGDHRNVAFFKKNNISIQE